METKHTPTPWQFEGGWIEQVHPDGDTVAFFDDPTTHADAKYIVQCVNSHAALVDALETVRLGLLNSNNGWRTPYGRDALEMSAAALALAKGEK